MCKIIIVGDEDMAPLGIQQVIPWERIGIQEVFTAASGNEALGIIKQEMPEVVLVNISMEEMSGLGLIQAIRKMNTEAKIIVLTGDDKLKYAREFLHLHIYDLYLKPIDVEVLCESICRLVEEVRVSREKGEKERLLQRTHGSIQQIRLEHMMREIIENKESKAQHIITLKQEYFYEPELKLQIAIVEPVLYDNQRKYEMNFYAMSVKNTCIRLVDAMKKGITFLDSAYRIVIAYFVEEQNSVLEQIQQLSEVLKDEFEIVPKILVGDEVIGFLQLYTSYNDALYLSEYEKDDFQESVQMGDSLNRNDIFVEVFHEMKLKMSQNVGDKDYILRVYESFVKAGESYNLSESYMKRCCFELVSDVYYAYINETGSSIDTRLNTYLQALMNAGGQEACEITKEFLRNLVDHKVIDSHEIISEAKRYIDQHLGEDISVSNIAAIFYVSPNYFSRLFKRIQGEGCNEYIIKKRIEKAKSLLKLTNFKVGKIAAMVGYRDANYFTLAFKKHTGMSPIEYREKVRE